MSAGAGPLSAFHSRPNADGRRAGGSERRAALSPDGILALVVALVALIVYWRTLAPGVLAGDSGELQFAAYLGGIAHPTGYPLYLIVGWLWSHLIPLGSPAWRMNLLSAVAGGVAVGLTYLMTEQLLRSAALTLPAAARRLAAVVAALALACSELFWSQAVVTEIYTLHAAFVAGLLWLLLRWAASAGHHDGSALSRGLGAVAPLYGLSLAHHRTMLLLAPAALLFVWCVWRDAAGRGWKWSGRGWLRVALLALAPLLLYAYIPLRAPASPYTTVRLDAGHSLQLYDQSLRGFVDFVLGRVFEGALLSPAEAWARLPVAARLLVRQFRWAGTTLALLGVIRLLLARRWRLLLLTGLSFIALVTFNLFYGIGDIAVFYITPALIFSGWIGAGAAAVGEAVARALAVGRRPAQSRVTSLVVSLIVAFLIALPVWLWADNRPVVDRSSDTADAGRWRTILDSAPATDAVLVSNDRDEIMPLWYLQWIDGERRDITGLFPLIVAQPGWENVGQVVQRGLETGRPVCLIKSMPGLAVRFAVEDGALPRVLGPAVAAPPGHYVGADFGATVRLLGYDLRSSGGDELRAAQELSDGLQVAIQWQALAVFDGDFTSFVHLLDAQGQKVAQSDHLVGGAYYPTSLWQPGETLLDVHELSVPATAAASALRIGFYRQPPLELLGEPITITLP